MKIYIVISGLALLVVWFWYGTYVEHIILNKSLKNNEKKIFEDLRMFTAKSTGLRLVMLKKETWQIDDKLNAYMLMYIFCVANLLVTGLLSLKTDL